MNIIFSPSATTVRGFKPEDDFTYTVTPNPGTATSSDSVSTISPYYDVDTVTHTIHSYSGVPSNFSISVNPSFTNPNSTKSFRAISPTLATVDGAGNVTYVANETATIAITSGSIERRYSQVMVSAGAFSTTTDSINFYKTGSLGAITQALVASTISGKTAQGNVYFPASGSQSIFTQNNFEAGPTNNAVWNTNCFAYAFIDSYCSQPVGVTAQQPSMTQGAYRPTLISPRHVIIANHVNNNVGEQLTFMSPSGTKQTVSVIATYSFSDPVHDTAIAYLSAPVTVANPVLTMPPAWRNYIRSLLDTQCGEIPVFTHAVWTPDKNWAMPFIRIHRLRMVADTPIFQDEVICDTHPSSSQFYAWDSNVWPGDSGGWISVPMVIAGQPKLVLLTTYSATTVGYGYEKNAATINAAMQSTSNANGDGINDPTTGQPYALLEADLSGFTAY